MFGRKKKSKAPAAAEHTNAEPLTREMLLKMVREFDKSGGPKTAAQLHADLRVNKRWLLQLLAKYARHMHLSGPEFTEELKRSTLLDNRFRYALIRYVRRFGVPEVPKLTVDDIANENWIDIRNWSRDYQVRVIDDSR